MVINPVFAIATIKTLTEPIVNTKFQFTPLLNSSKERISIDGMKKIIKPIIAINVIFNAGTKLLRNHPKITSNTVAKTM